MPILESIASIAFLGFYIAPPLGWTAVILPIGISFYTFESISYTFDVYRRETEPASSFWNYAGFIVFFPHLIAGPIIRYRDIGPQLIGKRHQLSEVCHGAALFILGLGKKLLVADGIAPLVEGVFNGTSHGFVDSWIAVFGFTMQLYFDFSGYTDMAIGLAALFGFRFPQNFNAPYHAESISDFWSRWHMSLSSWLKDYLYIPLGGNRKGPGRTFLNLFATMLIGGLWHGANWTYVCWGGYHGALLVGQRFWNKQKLPASSWRPFNIALTFVLVMVGWAIFRAPDLSVMRTVFAGMCGLQGFSNLAQLGPQLRPITVLALVIAPLIVVFAPKSHVFVEKMGFSKVLFILSLLVFCFFKMVLSTQRTFLYFQF